MSCCWDMDRREYIPGKWNQEKERYVITGRRTWQDILGKEGMEFVADLLRRMIEHEAKHGGKPLILTQIESEQWHKACDMCFEEGWDRFYFDDRGVLHCASRIKIARQTEGRPRFASQPKRPESGGPLADSLAGFIEEPIKHEA